MTQPSTTPLAIPNLREIEHRVTYHPTACNGQPAYQVSAVFADCSRAALVNTVEDVEAFLDDCEIRHVGYQEAWQQAFDTMCNRRLNP